MRKGLKKKKFLLLPRLVETEEQKEAGLRRNWENKARRASLSVTDSNASRAQNREAQQRLVSQKRDDERTSRQTQNCLQHKRRWHSALHRQVYCLYYRRVILKRMSGAIRTYQPSCVVICSQIVVQSHFYWHKQLVTLAMNACNNMTEDTSKQLAESISCYVKATIEVNGDPTRIWVQFLILHLRPKSHLARRP